MSKLVNRGAIRLWSLLFIMTTEAVQSNHCYGCAILYVYTTQVTYSMIEGTYWQRENACGVQRYGTPAQVPHPLTTELNAT